MASLRIAQLANFVSPQSGGMKVAIDQLGKGYIAAGHERILIIPGPKDNIRECEAGTIVEVASPKINRTYRLIISPWQVTKILEKFCPTSVECSDKWTLTPVAGWARRRGVGSALLSHERLDDMASGWIGTEVGVKPGVSLLNRRLAKIFDLVVVTSDYSAGEFVKTSARVRKISLGVDLDIFNPKAGAQPEGDVLQLCYVGRLSHEKYPQLAVAAAVELARRCRNFQLHVYGAGPDEKRLRALAGHAPVIFHGLIPSRHEVARRFANSHISLSVCPTETFGLAVLEALACGTPVVTSDRGGARELVDVTCGQWGQPNARAIADAVERLASRLRPELRLAARKRAEQFSWASSVSQMLQIHQELAEGKFRRPD